MCQKIVIDKGDKEVETPRQFLAHFGFALPIDKDETPADQEMIMDCCLCNYDLDSIFAGNGIAFVIHWGDYYIGDIEGITPGWD